MKAMHFNSFFTYSQSKNILQTEHHEEYVMTIYMHLNI